MKAIETLSFFVVGALFLVGVFALAGSFDSGGAPTVSLEWGTMIRGLFFFVMAAVLPFALFMAARRR